MGGVSAVVSKTAAAPIERVQLLIASLNLTKGLQTPLPEQLKMKVLCLYGEGTQLMSFVIFPLR